MPEMTGENRQDEVLHAISRLSRTMRRVRKDCDTMPAGQFYPLRVIAEHPGITAGKLASVLDIRPSSLTEALDRAEEKGLLVRTADVKDARITHLALTEDGKAAVEKRNSLLYAERAVLARTLTAEETEKFCTLCEKIRSSLEEEFK